MPLNVNDDKVKGKREDILQFFTNLPVLVRFPTDSKNFVYYLVISDRSVEPIEFKLVSLHEGDVCCKYGTIVELINYWASKNMQVVDAELTVNKILWESKEIES